jgi:hypothetical protein
MKTSLFTRIQTAALASIIAAGALSIFPAAASAGWMAFAVDDKGAIGHGAAPDKQTAKNFALSYCGNANCHVISTTTARCNAIYQSFTNGYWWGVGAAPTMSGAMGFAVNYCSQNAPAGTCKLAYKFCQ